MKANLKRKTISTISLCDLEGTIDEAIILLNSLRDSRYKDLKIEYSVTHERGYGGDSYEVHGLELTGIPVKAKAKSNKRAGCSHCDSKPQQDTK
jgi:hypothetical protein